MADFEEFRDTIKKVNHKRTIKVTNSYGVADGYKYYKKIKPKDSKFNITNSDYRYIIRRVNTELGELFIKGEDIIFPYRLGRLELRKIESKIKFDGNKVKTNLPIDWDKTLKFWYEDEEAYKNKTLIKAEEKEIFRIYYNKNIADFINKSFYIFKLNRTLKLKLKHNIQECNIDAFKMY